MYSCVSIYNFLWDREFVQTSWTQTVCHSWNISVVGSGRLTLLSVLFCIMSPSPLPPLSLSLSLSPTLSPPPHLSLFPPLVVHGASHRKQHSWLCSQGSFQDSKRLSTTPAAELFIWKSCCLPLCHESNQSHSDDKTEKKAYNKKPMLT